MIDQKLMRFEEKAVFTLRSLYRKYGYLPYKMSKFEEYELYIRNKDFLVSDRVISFNDTNGKLMALKPDVTLSIIKGGEDRAGEKQRVFYNENVYRVSESTHRFKEIMQTGLECIGDIDIYDIYEVISLAAQSLATICDDFYIEISNMDVVCSVLSGVCGNKEFVNAAIKCISQKNKHDLKTVCNEFSVDENGYRKISNLISLYGERSAVIESIKEICEPTLVDIMIKLSNLLRKSEFGDRIKFDFSAVNDMNYYNGFVFKGFVSGIFCDVLSGGQYDNMMKRMKRKSSAVGFALYLDRMDDLNCKEVSYDVDYVLIYDELTDFMKLSSKVKEFIDSGFSVSTQKTVPANLRYKNILYLNKEG
ncbi:MAG: ATP phosphoribosyltransferase regulatory subunit [Clostridia bacterium]|nr:ATP phosphoribosyltransferase regulatory subunit [Clostridia bacterium]